MENTIEAAAVATGFPLEKAEAALKHVKEMAVKHERHVQFWLLADDSMWPSGAGTMKDKELLHLRLFAATRLIYEYTGPAGRTVSNVEERIEDLKEVILRVAELLRQEKELAEMRLQAVLGNRYQELQELMAASN